MIQKKPPQKNPLEFLVFFLFTPSVALLRIPSSVAVRKVNSIAQML
uniref:Uncharacterized protein n=1 Tax=Ascaris lumbricoides TaxID=6252 RepID=A0A0M3HIJ3_ASCLU